MAEPGINYPGSLDDDASLISAANNVQTTLDGALADDTQGNNAQATDIDITDASNFPIAGYITVGSEIIHYTGKTTNKLNGITRAADNSTRAAHADDVPVLLYVIAKHHNQLKDAIVAVETELGTDPAGTESTVKDRLTTLDNKTGIDDFTVKRVSNELKVADRFELNTMLNAFRIAINGSLSVQNMVDGIIDEFEDETGVDTGASTNEDYDATNDLYKPTKEIVDIIDYMEYANDVAAQIAYVTSAPGGDIVQSYVTGANSSLAIGNGGWVMAQSFTLAEERTLGTVSLLAMANTGSPTSGVTVTIETDSGGDPSDVLVHANATKTQAWTVDVWNDFVFDNSFVLSAGTYWLVAECTDGVGDYYTWAVDTTGEYAGGHSAESEDNRASWNHRGNAYDTLFKIITAPANLKAYSESTIKTQGSYSLKGDAVITDSLNDTLTRTVSPTIDLSGQNTIKFDIRSNRTGANIKIGIHDSGGTTSEKIYTVLIANTWETVTWDISGISDANKNAIDQIIITIINADVANTFYIDNFYAGQNLTLNMTLISVSNTAEAQPSDARIVLFEEDVDSITINTDLKAYVSRDGGTTYSQVTLVDEGDYENGKRILIGTVDVSGQPAGTSIKWKAETLNNKDLKLHGIGELWD